jgi:hypothetical protein
VPEYPTETGGVVHPERDEGPRRVLVRRIAYGVTSLLLAALVVSAVVDATTEIDVWGVADDRARAIGDGYVLEVEYPTVTRPALATPFAIVVRHPGGFDGPVDLAISSEWLEMWDFQALYPDPSGVVGGAERVVMTFEPPEGDVLRVFLDARIQPSQQSGRNGKVALLDELGAVVASVEFHTRVMP